MQLPTIRFLDRWLGVFLCALLTVHRKIFDLFRGRQLSHPKKILFLKLIEQGATVLAFSALRRAIDRVGAENIYFLVFAENRPILDVMELIPEANVLAIRHHQFRFFILDIAKALLKIRRAKIDTTIDMEFFSRASAVIAYLSGARRRVGLHRFHSEAPYRGNLLTHRLQHNPYLHTAKSYLALVEALDHSPAEVPLLKVKTNNWPNECPRFRPTPKELIKVRQLIAPIKPGPPLVLLNPNAGDMMPLRKWGMERFQTLGEMLLREFSDLTLVMTGSAAEAKIVEGFVRQLNSPRALSVAGRTSLRELLTLYSIADVLVTNDSGPAHFSSMTDIHSIVLFGPETPDLFGALSPNSQMISARLACSPCLTAFNHRSSPCQNNLCMQMISAGEVFSRVVAILEAKSPFPRITPNMVGAALRHNQ